MTVTERGCALQSYTYQDLVRGKWQTITTIVVIMTIMMNMMIIMMLNMIYMMIMLALLCRRRCILLAV